MHVLFLDDSFESRKGDIYIYTVNLNCWLQNCGQRQYLIKQVLC